MALVTVKQDSTFKCVACGSLLQAKKGQLLPPCPRCGGKLENFGSAGPAGIHACCPR